MKKEHEQVSQTLEKKVRAALLRWANVRTCTLLRVCVCDFVNIECVAAEKCGIAVRCPLGHRQRYARMFTLPFAHARIHASHLSEANFLSI